MLQNPETEGFDIFMQEIIAPNSKFDYKSQMFSVFAQFFLAFSAFARRNMYDSCCFVINKTLFVLFHDFEQRNLRS